MTDRFISGVPGNRHFFLFSGLAVRRIAGRLPILLATVAALVLSACGPEPEPWTGVWTGTPMTGYDLEYRLGSREYAMQMTDGSGAVVMASKGTIEVLETRLLLTETSRFVASADAHAGTWKTTSDTFRVEWSIDSQGNLLWKPEGTNQSIALGRKGN